MDKQSFEDLYNNIKDNEELNTLYKEERKENKKTNIIVLIICLIIDIIIFALSYINISKAGMSSYIVPIIVSIIVLDLFIFAISSLFRKKEKEFIKGYKSVAINKLIENFYTSVEYFPEKGISRGTYDEGDYKEYYNRYHSDDYVEAQIDGKYMMSMGEVHTIDEETNTDSEGHTTTTETTKFHGLFAKIELDKSIKNVFKILPNHSVLFGKNKVEMDSTEFEKKFDIYSTDKILSMRLLTSDVMEEIVDFKNKIDYHFDISIINNYIYIRFHCGSIFEPKKMKKGPVEEKSLKSYYNILNFSYDLSKKMIDIIDKIEL